MSIGNFNEFIKESRILFREHISTYLTKGSLIMKTLIKEMLEKCESDFEIETLKENLQEEFKLYLDAIERGE